MLVDTWRHEHQDGRVTTTARDPAHADRGSSVPAKVAPLSAERFQYRVGHGGFHATIVEGGGSTDSHLVYVYDVGAAPSKPLLRTAIGSFVAELRKRSLTRVDYVIVSHIDEDHVNGIDELLNALKFASINVGNVILPWLTSAEKLLTKSRTPRRGRSTVVMNLAGSDHDAREYLLHLGAEEVTFLRTDSDSRPDEPVPLSTAVSGRNLASGLLPSWKLVAVRIDPPTAALDAFVADLKARIQSHNSSLDPRKVSDHAACLTKYRAEIRAAMRSKTVRKELRTTKIGPSLTNWSSISLYGGAASSGTCTPVKPRVADDLMMSCVHGWLHTGDLPLNVRDVWDAFEHEWKRHLGPVQVCALTAPHHGSKHSHKRTLYTYFKPSTVILTTGRTRLGKVSRLINTSKASREARNSGATVTELHN